MTQDHQNNLNLFLLSELERMNALFERLEERGVISQSDVAIAQLQADLRFEERKLSTALKIGDRTKIAESEVKVRDLAARIDALEVGTR